MKYQALVASIVLAILCIMLPLSSSGCETGYTFTVYGIVRWDLSGFRASNVEVWIVDTGNYPWDVVSQEQDENGTYYEVHPEGQSGVKRYGERTSTKGYYKHYLQNIVFSGEPGLRLMHYIGNTSSDVSSFDEVDNIEIENWDYKEINLTAASRFLNSKYSVIEGDLRAVNGVGQPALMLVRDNGAANYIVGSELVMNRLRKIVSRGRIKLWVNATAVQLRSGSAVEAVTFAIKTSGWLMGNIFLRDDQWTTDGNGNKTLVKADFYLSDGRENIKILNVPQAIWSSVKPTSGPRGPGPTGPMVAILISGEDQDANGTMTCDHIVSYIILD